MMLRLLLPIACAAPLAAQNLVVNDPPLGMFVESAGVSPLYPGGAPAVNAYPQLFPLPIAPAPIAGAVSIDNTTGLTWYTDGFMIAAHTHSAYVPGAPPIAPYPAPFLGGGTPISGMAIDPVAGLLWLTDGVFVAATVPAPFGPVVIAPFPAAFAVAPLTGLEWDTLTGTLWAVDAAGTVYNFTPAGILVAPPLVAPPFVLPPSGITIDKSGGTIAPLPSVYVTGAGMIFDLMTGVAMPTGGSGLEVGISYHAAPSQFPPGPPCPCPTFPGYGHALLGPSTAGNPAFGVDLVGLPPGNIVIFGIDFMPFNPAFPVVNGLGCPFGLNFGSAIGFFGVAGPGGVATFPLSLAAVPPGFLFNLQYVLACPADPVLGIAITPMYQVVVSAP